MEKRFRKLWIRDPDKTDDPKVRAAYGQYAGAVGIVCNLLLFLCKFLTGIFSHSASIVADAFNNLSDAATSIISAAGMRMAGKPADKEHPFGHGRIEYIAAFIVAICIIEVGIGFFKQAIQKIQHPEILTVRFVFIGILCVSVLVKLYLALFYKRIGTLIQAASIQAASADSLFDAVSTGVTLISLILSALFRIHADGIATLFVALFVIWGGIGVARDVLSPLIGNKMDQGMYEKLEAALLSVKGVEGVHELIIHNYGPANSMASAHIEVSEKLDLLQAHEIADEAELCVQRMLGISLVVHVDPSQMKNQLVRKMYSRIKLMADIVDERLGIHDFRCTEENGVIRQVYFDLVIPVEIQNGEEAERKVRLLTQNLFPEAELKINAERGIFSKTEG